MKNRFFKASMPVALVAWSLTAIFSVATAQTLNAETKADIERHRAMSVAHEAAAKCLESGKKEDVCMKDLQASCKGLAVGKYCGMKHAH